MGTYETQNPEPVGVTTEGITGDVASGQPTERDWTGDTDPKQATAEEAPEGLTGHSAEAGRAGTGPGPSGSGGPSGTEYGSESQTQGHG